LKKGFLVGIILGLLCFSSVVYAADNIMKIKQVEYNDTSVLFNGEKIDLNGKNLISIINEGEKNITNYIPLRAVFESLGYGVSWESNKFNTSVIEILTEEYLINSDKWVNYQRMLDILDIYSPCTNYNDLKLEFKYVESAKAVQKWFSYPPSTPVLYFTTAVINNDKNKIYIKKSELDSYFTHELDGVPLIDEFTEDVIENLKKFYEGVVTFSEINKIIGGYLMSYHSQYDNLQRWLTSGLQIAYNYTDERFEIYYDAELQGYAESAEFAPGWNRAGYRFMKKEDLNYYLKKYGFTEIK